MEESVKCYTLALDYSKKCYEILNNQEKLIVSKMTEMGLVDFKVE